MDLQESPRLASDSRQASAYAWKKRQRKPSLVGYAHKVSLQAVK